jgi:hypothetical protein
MSMGIFLKIREMRKEINKKRKDETAQSKSL